MGPGLIILSSINGAAEDELATFWSLSDSARECKTLAGIYLSNYFRLGEAGTGVLPLITRVNHACAANAEAVWNKECA